MNNHVLIPTNINDITDSLSLNTKVVYIYGCLTQCDSWGIMVNNQNLIANKMIMPEYLQYNINANRIAQDITSILSNKKKSLTIKNELTIIKKKLGRPGATSRAANIIYKNLKKSF